MWPMVLANGTVEVFTKLGDNDRACKLDARPGPDPKPSDLGGEIHTDFSELCLWPPELIKAGLYGINDSGFGVCTASGIM